MQMETVEKCRIQFSASGKYAEENIIPVYISGNTMRDMVGRIIEQCVAAGRGAQQASAGGVGTRYIRRTLDWLVERGTGFPERLDIRAYHDDTDSCLKLIQTAITTTFLTAMIFSGERLTDYEPGAQSPVVSRVLLGWIGDAAGKLPHSSPFWGVLADRYYYIWKANKGQELGFGDEGEVPRWWDDVPDIPHLELGHANGTNFTGGGVNVARRGSQRRLW